MIKNDDWFGNDCKTYNDLLKKLVCKEPTLECYFRTCKKCPKSNEIKNQFVKMFEENEIEEVSYKLWATTDRCKLMNVTDKVEEFTDSLVESLGKLVPHDYISKTQAKYFRELKDNLKEGEIIVTLDFSENYSVVIQDAVQGFYWNNVQISILTSVIYYKENGILKHLSYIGVLESLSHDTISVYMFQKKLMELVKSKISNINKIYYFTDGAGQHFKNKKNFLNATLHHQDFGIRAEWHFFATAHGKGPCDGLGGMVKAEARKACLKFGSENHILNALDFYEWAQDKFESINFIYCSNDDYTSTSTLLEDRFKSIKTVKGTLGFHAFVPETDQMFKLRAKTVSTSSKSKLFSLK